VGARRLPGTQAPAVELAIQEDALTDADRELLEQAENALRSFSLRALAVSPRLKEPYTDDPTQSPWSRTIGPEARRAHDLAMTIRKRHGGERHTAMRAITTPLTEAETDVYQAGAAAERERLGREQIEHQERYHYCPTCGGDMVTEPSRVIAEAVAAERKRIYDELGHDHFVIFTADRWTVEHSVECRLSGHMHECEYHVALRCITKRKPKRDMLGRWRIASIDSGGLPDLVRAE
jgi:hypothetical protein